MPLEGWSGRELPSAGRTGGRGAFVCTMVDCGREATHVLVPLPFMGQTWGGKAYCQDCVRELDTQMAEAGVVNTPPEIERPPFDDFLSNGWDPIQGCNCEPCQRHWSGQEGLVTAE